MDALADKMEAIQIPVAVYDLEIKDPLEEESMCCSQLFS
jgi:hypothetical protein